MAEKIDLSGWRPERFVSELQARGIEAHPRGASWVLVCPRCQKDKLYVRRRDGVSRCWVCTDQLKGLAGTVMWALGAGSSSSWNKVLYSVPDEEIFEAGFYLTADWSEPEFEGDEIVISDLETPPPCPFPDDVVALTSDAAARGRAYLTFRQIPLDVALAAGTHYSTRRRSLIWGLDWKGEQVGWHTRRCGTPDWVDKEGVLRKGSKAMTSAKAPHVLGLLPAPGSKAMILGEGFFDCLSFRRAGLQASPTMGKGLSRYSMAQIEDWVAAGGEEVVVAWDPDAFMEVEALKALALPDCRWTQALPPAGVKDFGACTDDQILEALASREDLRGAFHLYLGEI